MQSIGGGTGSGFGSLLMSRLRDEYSDRIISTFTVIPSSKVSGFPIEPYNAVFAAHYLLSDTNACVVLDNETIYANLYLSGKTPVEVEKRTNFEDLNAVIETAINNVTRVFRFPGQLHGDFRKFVLKMVPVPRLQFLTVGCVPMCYSNHLALQMNKSVMSAYSTTARFAHTCIFRGSVSCKRACNFMKDYVDLHQAQFLKCSPTFNVIHNSNKTCFNHVEDGEIHMSFIENNAGTVEVWKRVYKEFRYLYKRKAFLSCYISEGMDEGEVVAAQKSLIELISDYSSYAPQRTGLEVH